MKPKNIVITGQKGEGMTYPNMAVSVKPEATILDATSSNRSMWRKKENPLILWIDIDSELRIKPDIILDCRDTSFPNESISTIFFDPPHWWGDETGKSLFTCRNKDELKKFLESSGFTQNYGNTYYGTDKYKTKTELLSFLHKSQKEFNRILKKDGILWLIWSEVKLPLNKILPFFNNWNEMIRLHIASPHQTFGESKNYWVMFMKKETTIKTLDLTEFANIEEKEKEAEE